MRGPRGPRACFQSDSPVGTRSARSAGSSRALGAEFMYRLVPALIAGLAFVAPQPVPLIARLALVALLTRGGESGVQSAAGLAVALLGGDAERSAQREEN